MDAVSELCYKAINLFDYSTVSEKMEWSWEQDELDK